MRFVVRPKEEEERIQITLELPKSQHERLEAAGRKHGLPATEVLQQFIRWAIESGELGGKRKGGVKQ